MNASFHTAFVVVAALLSFAGRVYAEPADAEHRLGQHPAVLVKQQVATIDTNRFILAHPAQLHVIATPTPTYDHPAGAVQRMARDAAAANAEMDRNLAQPPVASAWLRRSAITTASPATPVSGG